MNIPTTLPFFNGIRKQATRRDSSAEVIFSPRTQLPPFQIQRPHVADDWVDDIILVDCDGNEINLQKYFENSVELLIGGFLNGAGGFQNMDTLTQESETITGGPTWWIDSAVKTTTGAGDAGFDSAVNSFSVTEDERLYLEIDLDLDSGVAPKVYISDGNDNPISDEVLLVNGINHIVFTITTTDGTATLLFYNDTADQTDFSATMTLTRTIRPIVHEFTDIDYIQYNGNSLVWTGNLIEEIGSFGINAFDTFIVGVGVSISSAIEVAGGALASSAQSLDSTPKEGDIYKVYISDVVINSGETPTVNISNSDEGFQNINAGDNEYTFTIKFNPIGSVRLQIAVSNPSDFETGQIAVYKSIGDSEDNSLQGKGLLPKGTYYLKLTDGTNEWYSEWLNIRDIYENLISGIINTTYETLISDGTKIISAIETGSSGKLLSLPDEEFDVENDEEIIVIFFLNMNSGQVPQVLLVDFTAAANASNVVNAAAGINEITLVSIGSATVKFRLQNTAAANWSTSEIWVKRQYSPDFVKLSFSDTHDLRGKRDDDQTILYQKSFVQECWLNTIMNTPAQNRIDIGEEKDGVFIPEKIITQYKYRIIDYINRSLFQGLLKLPQHDSITIIDEVGNEYTPDTGNIETSIEWNTFDTGTFIIEFNDGSFIWRENSDDIT